MSKLFDILPRNATAMEKALANALEDVLPIPIRDLLDPDKTTEEFLPFLASHRSVDLWFSDWPLERKRLIVKRWPAIAAILGTPQALLDILPFVDAELLDKISHPTRFVFGRSAIGRTPIGHPALAARHLVKTETFRPPRSFRIGRSAFGTPRIKTPSRDKITKILKAMAIAKGSAAEYRADFAHMRLARLSDGLTLSSNLHLGQHLNRVRL